MSSQQSFVPPLPRPVSKKIDIVNPATGKVISFQRGLKLGDNKPAKPRRKTYTIEFLLILRKENTRRPADLPDIIRSNFRLLNRPVPTPKSRWKSAVASNQDEVLYKKVKALLNKLTLEKFATISNQIVAAGEYTETSIDGALVLVFDKATDEPHFSKMYAMLCQQLAQKLPQIFRPKLLAKCREEFEQNADWTTELVVGMGIVQQEAEYERAKAKRRYLGNVKFIGELYKLSMLNDKTICICISQLIKKVDDPDEEEIESLCRLISTIGSTYDTTAHKVMMDQISEFCMTHSHNKTLSSRVRFMLMDLLDLRASCWTTKNVAPTPMTLDEIHAQIELENTVKPPGRRPPKNPNVQPSSLSWRRKDPVIKADVKSLKKNSFAALEPPDVEDDDAPDPDPTTILKLESITRTFLLLKNKDELIDELDELHTPDAYAQVATNLIVQSMELKQVQVDAAADMISWMVDNKHLASEQVEKSLVDYCADLSDLVFDIPQIYSLVATLAMRLRKSNTITRTFVAEKLMEDTKRLLNLHQ